MDKLLATIPNQLFISMQHGHDFYKLVKVSLIVLFLFLLLANTVIACLDVECGSPNSPPLPRVTFGLGGGARHASKYMNPNIR
ncbi:hypothetical protein VNO77_16667 [Canavalia gladiata]|uniref:Uncharacterized protein n=1 Tax=Canavalia gladiata TaxID=3824 RepID=A0AAN9LHQ7_CANGL